MSHRIPEVLCVLLWGFAVITFLSLITYSPGEFETLGMTEVTNIIGPLGVVLSHMLRISFGVAAYFIVVMLLLAGWSLIKYKSIEPMLESLFALAFTMVSTSLLVTMIFPHTILPNAGGMVGMALSYIFNAIVGTTGTWIVTVMLIGIALILLGIVSLSHIVQKNSFTSLWKIVFTVNKIFTHFFHRKKPPLIRITQHSNNNRLPWIVKTKVTITNSKEKKPTLIEYHSVLNTRCDDFNVSYQSAFPQSHESDLCTLKLHQGHPLLESSYSTDRRDECSKDAAMNDEHNDEKGKNYSLHQENYQHGDFDEHGTEHNVEMPEPPLKGICSSDHGSHCEIQMSNPAKPSVTSDITDVDYEMVSDEETSDMVTRNVFGEIALGQSYSIPVDFLQEHTSPDETVSRQEIVKNSELLVNTLRDFGIESKVVNVNRGPVITLYELQIAPGIKVNRIVSLADDIAMALAASRVRVVAPIPGKKAIGVEIPNKVRETVTLKDIILSQEFIQQQGRLKIGLGKDIMGKPVVIDLKKQPHLLIAGATGSGKSVCVHSIVTSLLYNYDPNYVRFIMVDPKLVELQIYNGIPHLLTPVIIEPFMVPKALKWTLLEMERRYYLLSEYNTRDIDRYNQIVERNKKGERLPYIVIIMDELADLMMVAAKEIEGYITRIAQKARAVGIHLVLATQRPSVDIITGIIKANFPARIAFQVPQKTDSRTIIDQNGAEKLLGKGDMLYQSPTSSFPIRIQGAFISEDELSAIVAHLRKMAKPEYINIEQSVVEFDEDDDDSEDELFLEALKIVETTKKASASYLQRRLSIGYNRAARIIERMEELGYIGPQQGSKPRDVYI